jgi:hypothetical protein
MTNKKLSLPATFQEKHRHYTLDIFPEGRMGTGASSAEGCLATITYLADGATFLIVARYKDTEIGRGHYRKHGPYGQVTTVEMLESKGAMIGLIEVALAKREEARQVAERQARASRLLPLPCPSCGHVLGYDPSDQLFAEPDGEVISTCNYCGEILSLERFEQHYAQRIRQIRADLHHAEEAQRQMLAIKTKEGGSKHYKRG